MDRVLLSWTIENWITVVLMAFLGYLVFALIAQLFKSGGGSFFHLNGLLHKTTAHGAAAASSDE